MRCRLAIVLLALLAGHSFAGNIQGTCDVRFETSTLHDFSGTVTSRPFAAPVSRDAAGNPVVPRVELEFPVAEMRTGNDSREEKMREMFQPDRHPVVRAVARDVDAGKVRERMRKDPGPGEAVRIAKVYLLQWHDEGDLPYAALVRRMPHGDAAVRRCETWLQENFQASKR